MKRIVRVRPTGNYEVELPFTDGSVGTVDLAPWIIGRTGVLGALRDPQFFSRVAVDPEAGTIVWPNGADLCPDVLADAVQVAARTT